MVDSGHKIVVLSTRFHVETGHVGRGGVHQQAFRDVIGKNGGMGGFSHPGLISRGGREGGRQDLTERSSKARDADCPHWH